MEEKPLQVANHTNFDMVEFRDRWERARLSALKSVLRAAESADEGCCGCACSERNLDERQMLHEIPEEPQDDVLRRVFENSRAVGLSVVRHLGVTWEISDLAEVLPHMGSPCFAGLWRKHNDAYVLERTGCGELAKLGSFGCDYWREPLDGLITGVGENERLSRHESRGHGDGRCIDVIFEEVFTMPRVVAAEAGRHDAPRSLKFGAVPDEIAHGLEPLRSRFQAMKVRVVFEGVSEGTLYYRLDAEEGVLCGAGGKFLHDSLTDEVTRLFPRLRLKDTAPLAVYGGAS